MSAATVAALRAAVGDLTVVERYWNMVQLRGPSDCWMWLGAMVRSGHGRFQLSDTYTASGSARRRITFVVISHRFGYAIDNGVDALLQVPALAHACDNPLCQNPAHWRESDPGANQRDFVDRRAEVLGPLADLRGARGRARAIRDAARTGGNIDAVHLAGARQGHRSQLALFEELSRDYDASAVASLPVSLPKRSAGGQPSLFGSE